VKRVVVQGTSGSGKTTFSSALSERLGVPHVELDALHHGPNWNEASGDELRQRILAAIDGHDGWVVDGNYERKIGDLLLRQADTLVWLDLPLRVSLVRLWRRSRDRIRGDVELWNGNKESWRGAFWGTESLFAWAVRSHLRRRRTFPAHVETLKHLDVVRLRSEMEVAAWLDSLTVSA
jgi:hypothetical protein